MGKISILRKITERIFGKKFYVCVVNSVGSPNYFVNSTLYRSYNEVKQYKRMIEKECPSLNFIGYYSFRSRFDFRLSVSTGKKLSAEETLQWNEEEYKKNYDLKGYDEGTGTLK